MLFQSLLATKTGIRALTHKIMLDVLTLERPVAVVVSEATVVVGSASGGLPDSDGLPDSGEPLDSSSLASAGCSFADLQFE